MSAIKAGYKWGHVVIHAGGTGYMIEISEAFQFMDELNKAIDEAMLDEKARCLDQSKKFKAPAPCVE
jgi:hypothetical protein